MDDDTLMLHYEQLSIGQRPTLGLTKGETKADVIRYCSNLIRYIVKLCRWTPQEAVIKMTPQMMQSLHLDQVYRELYIRGLIEPGIDKKTDFRYLAHIAYPQEIPYSLRDRTLKVYEDVLSGKIGKFPKYFFDEKYGQTRAAICLLEAVKGMNVTSIEELYAFFANTPAAKKMLVGARLYSVCQTLYEDPLSYLHYSLIDAQKNDFLFSFYKFTNLLKQIEAEGNA